MRVLLDTQIWLWMLVDPDRFSDRVRTGLLLRPTTRLMLSAASTWEISIKVGLGKLEFPDRPERAIPGMMRDTRVEALDVSVSHTLRVGDLPLHHRDPFDRLLVAQAQLERIPILTADPVLSLYEVECLEP